MTDRAVLIGINAYPDPRDRLLGCVPDVAAWRDHLLKCGWPVAGIATLTDRAATRAGIRKAIDEAAVRSKSGDRLVIVYSGHGAQLVDGDASTDCLCPVDFDWTPETAITADDLRSLLAGLDDGVSCYVVLDACHSGGMGGDTTKGRSRRPRTLGARPACLQCMPQARAFHALQDVAVLSACASWETADDSEDEHGTPCGAFTHAFMASLDNPYCASWPLSRLVEHVAVALHGSGHSQTPQLTATAALRALPFLGDGPTK